MAEIFNAFIIEERFIPIWTMLDTIFKKVMTRVAFRKYMVDNLHQDICPAILKKIDRLKIYVGGSMQVEEEMVCIVLQMEVKVL